MFLQPTLKNEATTTTTKSPVNESEGLEEILRRQAEIDVLRPAGSRKYLDWDSIPRTGWDWLRQLSS